MKKIILVLFVSIFFISCSHKEKTVQMKYPSKQEQVQKIDKVDVLGEEIDGLDSDEFIKEEKVVNNYIGDNSKIAVSFPSLVLGKYAKSAISTILGFYTYKDIDYSVKTFDSLRETKEGIQKSFDDIKAGGFTKVIALYSPNALDILNEIDTEGLEVYLPLINKKDITNISESFIYGGISYTQQLEKLHKYSNINNVIFNQNSYLGNVLKSKYESVIQDIKLTKVIQNKRNYFKGIVKDYRLKNSSLFLNTDVVKTSILLSQLRVYETNPKVILSTQQNYNPKLLTLTQKKDREGFVVASSISTVDEKLEDIISNFGGNIKYNWVDYSTLVGINYLFDKNEDHLVKNEVEDNQVLYEVKLYNVTDYGFLEIKQDLDKIADIYNGE